MKYKLLAIYISINICGISCNPMDKIIRKETRINFKNEILFTGRLKEDSISDLLIFRKNNYFEYFTSNKRQNKSLRGYAGLYEIKYDSIFLNFYKQYQPPKMENYMLIDSAKNVLIYPFKDGIKRRYLSIKYVK